MYDFFLHLQHSQSDDLQRGAFEHVLIKCFGTAND